MAKILVIEDNLANMKLACLLLERAGHEVWRAVDAENGLTLARAEQPALDLDGYPTAWMDGSGGYHHPEAGCGHRRYSGGGPDRDGHERRPRKDNRSRLRRVHCQAFKLPRTVCSDRLLLPKVTPPATGFTTPS